MTGELNIPSVQGCSSWGIFRNAPFVLLGNRCIRSNANIDEYNEVGSVNDVLLFLYSLKAKVSEHFFESSVPSVLLSLYSFQCYKDGIAKGHGWREESSTC